jgi:hypothetical protein
VTRKRVQLLTADISVTVVHRRSRGHWYLDWMHEGQRHRPKLAPEFGRAVDAADEYVSRLLDRGRPDSPMLKHVAAEALLTKSPFQPSAPSARRLRRRGVM